LRCSCRPRRRRCFHHPPLFGLTNADVDDDDLHGKLNQCGKTRFGFGMPNNTLSSQRYNLVAKAIISNLVLEFGSMRPPTPMGYSKVTTTFPGSANRLFGGLVENS
jgi:hypothetical protein